MSQVIIEKDGLESKRNQTRKQEEKIDRHSFTKQWHKSDATKRLFAERVIGVLVLPIVALWTLIVGLGGVVLSIGSALFKLVGSLFSGKKDSE